MESNTTDQQYFGADLQLSEPHFDEEATLLSARRVVPLGEVRTKARSGRRLAFGLAIVVAIMAGAFGAALIYKQSGQSQATAIEDEGTPISERVVPEGQPLSGAGGATTDSHASSVAQNVATGEAHNNGAVTEIRRIAPLSSRSAKSGRADETLQNVAGSQRDERELRRAERMEARRLRRSVQRETKREARGQRSRSSDDLLRIRELFEGSPKP